MLGYLLPLGYRPILSLLRGTGFLLAATGLHGLLLPLRGQAEGFSTASLGLLGTAWAGGFVTGCILAPRLVRRIGHVRAFGTFAASGAIIALLTGLMIDQYVWIVLRAFTGFVMAGAYMVIESWLNEKATNENRGTVFGLYMIVSYASIMAGQMIVAMGDVRDASLFMVAGIFFCFALIPTAVSSAATPKPLEDVALDLKGLYATSPLALIGCFLIGVANGAWGTLGAVYGARIGIGNAGIALMTSVVVLAGAALQFPVGRLSDITDRRYVLAVARGRSGRLRASRLRPPAAVGRIGHRYDRGVRCPGQHPLFGRSGTCQRPRPSRRVRQGVERSAAVLWLRHDGRAGAGGRADGRDAAGELVPRYRSRPRSARRIRTAAHQPPRSGIAGGQGGVQDTAGRAGCDARIAAARSTHRIGARKPTSRARLHKALLIDYGALVPICEGTREPVG